VVDSDNRLPLSAIRRRQLLTIRDLAERAHCSKQTIVGIEHGQQVPHPGTMRRIAAALEVAPETVAEFAAAMGLESGDGHGAR
jgi:transcriptional regulator with XRE-family HTH domain